ncbi:FAD-dependent monooxygenase [Microlunatus aurantiacus]|uniref:FAD-dependent monooxygenase n=2 Tax=Microlunatus aurantiacus TaxID=446786 RepID=A0ABP7EHB3_9ACTN
MKILCVGGGPAGLYSALLLKRSDPHHQVTVFDRDVPGTVRGWGVTFWDDLLDAMRSADPESAAEVRDAATGWRGLAIDVEGRTRVEEPDFWGHSIARATLTAVLTRRAEELGVEIVRGQEANADDLSSEADLVVAADGVRSRFRAAHADELGARVAQGRNQFAWLSTPRLFPEFHFLFAEPPAGWISAYAYAYSDSASTFVVEMPPETHQRLGLGELGAEPALNRLQNLFDWQLEGARLRAQTDDAGRIPWASFPMVTCRRWRRANVALVGDAAHTTHYSIGFGTKLALEDAIALAAAMTEEADLSTALHLYESRRRRAIRRARVDARFSQTWFENASRYLPYEGEEFAMLLNRRRSPLVTYLPPQLMLSARRLVKRLT